jgi:hypothetical protein
MLDSAPSQEDKFISIREDLKLIDCLVQELLCCKLGVENCDTVAGHWLTIEMFLLDCTVWRTCLELEVAIMFV